MRYLFFILFLSLIIPSTAQYQHPSDDSLFFSKTLILKLKKEHSSLQTNDGIASTELGGLMMKYGVNRFTRIFPNHKTPADLVNEQGDTLIDLSLFYELQYSHPIHEQILASKIEALGLFSFVERKTKQYLLFMPNDSLLANQYYPERVMAFDAWDIETGDSNVVIGIIDSGTDLNGEDLKDGIKYNYNDPIDGFDNDNDGYLDNFYGWDMGMGDNNPTSYGSHHGCFTTGIASARVNNGVGIAGMGFNTRYLPVRITDENGYLNKSYEGIVYAADHGAKIINNSWGGHERNRFGQEIVNYATYNQNALVVAAGGNSSNSLHVYPASFENVISCAATDSLDQIWTYTSYGTTIDISAPGSSVWSTWTANGYFTSSGTSFAAPGVSGAAALIKSHFPQFTPLQIGEQLRVSADYIDTVPMNLPLSGLLGAGRLNMYRALTDTLKPAIRFRDRIVDAQSFMPGDTIRFSGKFLNLLAPSSNSLNVQVASTSPYLTVINPIKNIGQLATLSNTDNYNSPFLFKISPNTPPGTIADVKFAYSDTNYFGFEYFRFNLNPDYLNLDTNLITTSISSNGTIGYTDGTKSKGIGFYYGNSLDLIGVGGLVVGNSASKVSSNVYGASGYEADFRSLTTIQQVDPPTMGDQHFYSVFNDDSANFTKMNISVEQNAFSYDQNPDNVVFLTYTVKNNGGVPLSSLYIGFYADFDIGVSYKNKSFTDTDQKLGYTYSSTNGLHCGIMLLDSLITKIYHFDNDGSNNSIVIYDGFLDFEKYNAMQTNRDSAGYAQYFGNDVSTLASYGPFTLASGDSKTVTFAILASNNLTDLKNSAKKARDRYYNVASLSSPSYKTAVKVYPNPFENYTQITFLEPLKQSAQLKVFDSQGRMVHNQNLDAGRADYKIQLNHLEKGVYYFAVNIENEEFRGSFIKN